MAFLRLMCNRKVVAAEISAQGAWDVYARLRRDERTLFLEEPLSIETSWISLAGRTSGSNWTDAYLAAFAIESGLQLVTFDRGFRRFPKLDVLVLGER